MPIKKIESVRKRDGTIAPYDEQKIAEAIAKAARASGLDNGTIGRDLASVVTMYLERYHERQTPTSQEIQQLVEKILFDTGNAPIARSFIVYREKKGQPAESPAAPPAEDLFPTNLLLVDGATTGEVAPWGRERIIAALTKEAGLEQPAAAEIAGAVEQKIFRLGQRRVSTSLIRELVNHELLGRGYGSKLRRQIVVGLPKYDLGQLVGDEEAQIDPDAMCRTIGQATLRQYALQEIFARDVADAHIEGRLHLHGLEEPLKLHALSPSVASLRRTGVRVRGSSVLSEPARDARTFTAQLGRVIADARRYVSGPVMLSNLSEVYDQLLWGIDEDSVRTEVEHLAAVLEGATAGVHPRHRTATGIAAGGRALVTVSSVGEELKEFCRMAAERVMAFQFDRPASSGAPGSAGGLPAAWTATAHAITLNLPQAFYRSEAGTDFYSELETSIELAAKAHLQKRQLLRKFTDRSSGTFGSGAGWNVDGAGALRFDDFDYAVGVAGLNEVVRLLSGEEILGSDAAVRLALRIVSYIYFRLREESTRHGLRLILEDVPVADAADRFVKIDGQLYPRARGLLADRSRYTPGFRARSVPSFEALAVEARFHTLVPSARATVERSRLSAAELFAILGRLHSETQASRLAVE
jgi:anaerobic ribonucleoside-triphosphate reductase